MRFFSVALLIMAISSSTSFAQSLPPQFNDADVAHGGGPYTGPNIQYDPTLQASVAAHRKALVGLTDADSQLKRQTVDLIQAEIRLRMARHGGVLNADDRKVISDRLGAVKPKTAQAAN